MVFSAFLSPTGAQGQVLLSKFGNQGEFKSIKTTEIKGETYTAVLYTHRLYLMDQSGVQIADTAITEGRALATSEDTVFVFGKTGSASQYQLLKYEVDLPSKKFKTVTTAALPATYRSIGGSRTLDEETFGGISNRPFVRRTIDMTVTTKDANGSPDRKVWLGFIHRDGTIFEMMRFSHGEAGVAPKHDDIGISDNYVEPVGKHYRFMDTPNSVLKLRPLATVNIGATHRIIMETDPDGKSFWVAIPQELKSGTYAARVARIERQGEHGLFCADAGSHTDGGLDLANSGTSGSSTLLGGLAVDQNYAYLACWTKQGRSLIYRIPRIAFSNATPTHDASVTKLPPDTLVATVQHPLGEGTGTALINALVVNQIGKVTVAGEYGSHSLSFGSLSGSQTRSLQSVANENMFVASLTPKFDWDVLSVVPQAYAGSSQPGYDWAHIGLAKANSDGSNLMFCSKFFGAGEAQFGTSTYGGDQNSFGVLLSERTLSYAEKRYNLTVAAKFKAPDSTTEKQLKIPEVGNFSGDEGESKTVTLPENIYEKRDGSFVDLRGKSQAEIDLEIASPDVIARYRTTGYTVTRQGENQSEVGTDNSATVLMTKNTSITFNLERDFALDILSDLNGLPDLDPKSSQSLGSPDPPVGRHWVRNSDFKTPSINREVRSTLSLGTRYLARGYSITGVPNRTGADFTGGGNTASIDQFSMNDAVKITYLWKAQHSVNVAVSVAGAANLTAIQPKEGATVVTTGENWFDRNTEVTVGACDADPFQMKRVFQATGALQSIDQADRGALKDSFVFGSRTYRGKKITLTEGAQVTWDFGDPTYLQVVSIGNPVSFKPGGIGFASGDMVPEGTETKIDFSEPPKVTVVSARADTTAESAFEFSKSQKTAYPIRPGIYSLLWTRTAASGGGTLEMQVVAGFPGDTVKHPRLANPGIKFPGNPRDLRAVVHEDMPGIELDPSTEDNIAFRKLAYSEAAGGNAAGGEVVATYPAAPKAAPQLVGGGKVMDFEAPGSGDFDVEGRHVLVFSRSPVGATAKGDVESESTLVRILETRRWNAAKKWEATAANNRALSLDGKDGHVRTSLKSLASDNLTIQFWFKGRSITSAVRQQKGVDSIQVTGTSRFFAVPGTTYGINGPPELEGEQWRHVAMVYSRGGRMTVYFDGTVFRSVPASNSAFANLDTEVLFGAASTIGIMDEISIWNRALTDAEISSFKSTKAQLNGSEAGLLGYWNFDQETAQDLSPNQYHGELAGTASIVPVTDFVPLPPVDDTGEAMIALEKATATSPVGSPVPADIGKRLRDRLDLAGIGTGFVTGRLAPYNINLHQRGASAEAGPIFPVNLSQKAGDDYDLTVIWYERRDGVLWPWRPRRYTPQWATTKNRIVIASQLGSDGLDSDRVIQKKFDAASVEDLAVYVQNDRAVAGYNPNEEHALVAGSLRYGAEQPSPSTVFALRNDLNKAQDPDPSKNTSQPYVLAQYTDLATGEPQMVTYKVEREDQSVKAFTTAGGWVELRGGSGLTSDSGGELLFRMPGIKLYDGEAIRIRFNSGSITGLQSDQVVYPIFYGPTFDFRIAAIPGGPALTTPGSIASTVVLQIQRMHPYVFDYPAVAGLPVPVPYPLGNVIGALPPTQISGSDLTFGGLVPRVYYKDYKGTSWVVSGGGARFSVDYFYRIQPGFWTSDEASKQLAPDTPFQWHPTERTFYTANWPSQVPVLKAGETLTFSGGEYKADRPEQPGLPGVVGWAAGRIVYDSRTPAMDRGVTVAQQDAPFNDYTARLVAPLETRFVGLGSLGMSAADIAAFKELIAPATGVVSVDGAFWRFQKLPASLRGRIFFDPIENRLGMIGFVNGKTLGDRTLTAAPDPAYLLDPNILRPEDRDRLKTFKADSAELRTMGEIIGNPTRWNDLVEALYKATRNPDNIKRSATDNDSNNYYTGLTWAPQRDSVGNILRYDATGKPPAGAISSLIPTGYVGVPGQPVPTQYRAVPAALKGPGLALVASPKMLDPTVPEGDYYVTLAENDDASLGLPVTMHIVKVNPKHRFRGALKLVEGSNAFSEKVTLRHTADFGANSAGLEFQWFYRPEDGRSVPVPYNGGSSSVGAWQPFPGVQGGQIDFDAEGRFILPDMWFITRYRHVNDVDGSASWGSTRWSRDGKPDAGIKIGELWAGAANSPQPNGTYLGQLVPGWLKRVLDRINPYEARFNDFRNNDAPATYASMIQQIGPAYDGPVALNPDKDVVENVGLIQLYQTLLERGKGFAFASDIVDPALKSGVMNALQFAATRVQDLYMVLGNEAYADSQDPLVGFGSDSAEYGTTATGIWTFMNQTTDLLEEELGLLRGQSFSYGRPVFNRLFWNFTKDLGEVAYAQTYNINDENRDGFINESDARLLYPMGHGDAWGHFSTAVKMHYDLLKQPNFLWQPRSEFYSLLDTVVPVDFLDERKFAAAAAARARAGADIVKLTYRQLYTEDPDGQWQGYADVDADRAWGVEGWARRAGQGALLDWAVGNSLVPASVANRGAVVPVTSVSLLAPAPNARFQVAVNGGLRALDANGNQQTYLLTIRTADEEHEMIFVAGQGGLAQSNTLHFPSGVGDGATALQIGFAAGYDPGSLGAADFTLALHDRPEGIQRVDRGSVGPLDTIARQFAMIENTVADANGGLNPLGLAKDAVLFDVDPNQYTNAGNAVPAGHFEQIWERARRAVLNARNVFDGSTSMLNATRANLESLDSFALDVRDRDLDYRNRLIEIFGTPHEGNVGTGKTYPAGYAGPDMFFFSYVDVSDVTKDTVPAPPANSRVLESQYKGFKSGIIDSAADSGKSARNFYGDIVTKFFDNDLPDFAKLGNIDNTSIKLKFPIAASGYSFTKPAGWGNRAVTGELQTLISDLVQAQAAVYAASADYQQFEAEVEAAIDAVEARYSTAVFGLDQLYKERRIIAGLAATRAALQATSIIGFSVGERFELLKDALRDYTPNTFIAGLASGGDILKPLIVGLSAPLAGGQLGAYSIASAADVAAAALEPAFELANYNVAISDNEASGANEIRQQLLALKAMLSQEKGKRIAIFMAVEAMRQASDAYRSKLNVGLNLMAERADFNRTVAAQVQKHRYQDMTFRLFRAEALDAYHAALDLASRYTWLAGKAYAYETNLPDTHPGSATPILESIVGERLVGDLTNGEPVLGSGLGNWLALMRDNYSVLKGQLGLNNGQNENSKISLRAERFRKRASSDEAFRAELATFRHADLNLVPEFRRFCRPFAATTTTQPGLVIPLPTTITAGQNLFGMPLGPGDHSFDPSLFATKVRAVGVWFEGYDLSRFAAAPRVYLIPAGNDAMLEPTSTTFEPTWWNVVDQRIPVPHLMGSNPLSFPDWSPVVNTLDGPVGEIRKFSSFRAYSGLSGASVNDSEMSFDSRLVGRSVWNDRWLLVIPGQTLGANAPTILDEFLGANGIKDIHIVFKTTGFSGN